MAWWGWNDNLQAELVETAHEEATMRAENRLLTVLERQIDVLQAQNERLLAHIVELTKPVPMPWGDIPAPFSEEQEDELAMGANGKVNLNDPEIQAILEAADFPNTQIEFAD